MIESPDQEIERLQSIYWSKRDPDGLAFASLAAAHLRRGEVREALALLNDGTTRHPEYSTGHVMLTRLYYEQGMSSEAEFAARRVLELDAENLVGLSLLSKILEERGDDEAKDLRDLLISVDPDSEEAEHQGSDVAALEDDYFTDPWAPPEADDAVEGAAGSAVDESIAAGREDDEGPGGSALGELTLRDDLVVTEPPANAAAQPAHELPPVSSDESGSAPAFDDEEAWELMLARDAFGALPEPYGKTRDPGSPGPKDEPGGTEVLDVAALAPDREPDEAIDLAALAPEDEAETIDLAALAPDTTPEEDETIDMTELAPDDEPEEEMAIDLAALAPDPESDDAWAIDIAALAPDDEPEEGVAIDLAALAPDSDSESDDAGAIDLAALAPDSESDDAGAIDLAGGEPGPGPEPEVEATIDLGASAPKDGPDGGEPVDFAANAPEFESDVVESSEEGPGDPWSGAAVAAPESDRESADEPVRTRTLAELYVTQGFMEEAVAVYRHILREDPAADDVRDRIEELTRGGTGATEVEVSTRPLSPSEPTEAEVNASFANGGPVEDAEDDDRSPSKDASGATPPARAGGHHDEDLEEQARDLAGFGESGHDFDSPFAWNDEEAVAPADDDTPTIATYFDALLSWSPEEE